VPERRRIPTLLGAAVLALLLSALQAAAGTFEAPLQVDLAVEVSGRPGAGRTFSVPIESGDATVTGRVRNVRQDGTTRIALVFDYRVPRDTIALDELIEGFEITLLDAEQNVHAEFTADTALIHLNPNRAPLRYVVTLYTPPVETYTLRLRVFGNYE